MEPKLQELVEAVTGKTSAGALTWRSFSDESFRVPIGSGYLHIVRDLTRVEDSDGDSRPARTYLVQVTDAQGRVVTEATATQGFGEGDYPLLDGLFDAARRSALQTEGVLDQMLATLRAS